MKSLILITIFVLSVAGYFLFRDPEIQGTDIDEINHSLLASLDPNLGYAHNIDLQSIPNPDKFHFHFKDPDYQFLGNGLIKMSHLENQKPVIIGVLGSSSTDPFLFDGNWPLTLHKELKKKNIPHIIYNGAVSGYNSNQMLIKFTRDLMVIDKLRYLIIYHGASDCPLTEDTMVDHRDVHPRTLLNLQRVAKFTNQKDLSLWRRLKSSLLGEKYSIQLGVKENDHIKNYLKNMGFIHSIAKDNQLTFIHVQVLYPPANSQFVHDKDIIPPDQHFTNDYVSCLKDLNRALSTQPYSKSFQGLIQPSDPFFFDPMHLTPQGSQFLTEKIIQELKLIP